MQEINYGIYDKVSGLIVEPLTDKIIRSMAEASNESLAIIFDRYKSAVEKEGIKYFVRINTKEITCMTKKGVLKTPGKYFDNFDDAKEFLNEM